MKKFATKLSIAILAIAFCNTVWADALGVKLAVSSLRYVPAQKSEPINPEQKAWQDKAEKLLEVIYAGRLGNRVDPADIIYEAKRAGLDPTLIFATVEKLSGFEELYEDTNSNTGLMALQPSIQNQFGNKQNTLYQGKYNLRLGCSIIRSLLDSNKGKLQSAMLIFLAQATKQSRPDETYAVIIELWQRRAKQLKEPIPVEFNAE
jgi:soluble lytic murein transglycosylase-like protein